MRARELQQSAVGTKLQIIPLDTDTWLHIAQVTRGDTARCNRDLIRTRRYRLTVYRACALKLRARDDKKSSATALRVLRLNDPLPPLSSSSLLYFLYFFILPYNFVSHYTEANFSLPLLLIRIIGIYSILINNKM